MLREIRALRNELASLVILSKAMSAQSDQMRQNIAQIRTENRALVEHLKSKLLRP